MAEIGLKEIVVLLCLIALLLGAVWAGFFWRAPREALARSSVLKVVLALALVVASVFIASTF